ncbi:ScbR family autoregulator-binding transcription factor [Streptomyces sp. b94]|uniref:ScbR family autoregulator-binding transcription factor n=1 Tax=Streptomyces sp. b94 TaxID=1827634 RepID=UPI001FFCE4C9|nr:ScbR family autoregulator-binding transcription factor [Streptomyces sp. b94]
MMVMQVRAARTRQALLVAAAEVFADEGYVRASLPLICKRAGVSSGALHFHFASKDALAGEVESAAVDSAEKLAERCRAAAGTALQSMVDVTSGLMLAMISDPVVRAGFRLSADPSRKGGAELFQWWHASVRELVVRARDAGELAQDVSPEDAVAVIVAATVGFEALAGWDKDWLSAEGAARFWGFVLPRMAVSPELIPDGMSLGVKEGRP